jgi:hypothetical protein
MSRVGAYVFISHASADNARLRPVVLSLLEAGVPLWLDKPEAEGLDLSLSHFTGSIRKTDSWRTVVDQAIAGSCAMLVFPSKAAADAAELLRETQRGLAMMAQDAARYSLLPAFLSRADELFDAAVTGGVQGYNAWVEPLEGGGFRIAPTAEAELARLATYLLAKVAAADARDRSSATPTIPAEYHIPYLVNRSRQRDAVATFIRKHRSPILVARGRTEDEMGRFLSVTLARRVLPLSGRAVCTAESLQILRIRWPTVSTSDSQAFSQSLVESLDERFQLSSRIGQLGSPVTLHDRKDRLAAAFADNGVCRIVAARVTLSPRDKSSLSSAVQAWGQFWRSFPLEEANVVALTILPVLEILFDTRARPSRSFLDIFKSGLKLATPTPDASLCLIPDLADVTPQCAREWVETDPLFADRPDGVRDQLSDDFVGLFAGQPRIGAMPMKFWAANASPLLLQAGYE